MTLDDDTVERYARLVKHEPIMTQTDIQDKTGETMYSDDVTVFYSSGDRPKMIPYSTQDQEQIAQVMATTFRLAGLDEDDVVLNLGAPPASNHQSGWGITHGSRTAGATVINESIEDFMEPSVRDRWDEVTTVMSLPRMLPSLGDRVESMYGDLEDLFPNVERAITAGDAFPQRLRDRVKEQWGFDEAYNFYAAAEMSAVAGEDREGSDMVQTNDGLYIEILDPDAEIDPDTGRAPEDAITAIYDIDGSVSGTGLFSAPDRELLPFIRYRAGDVITAYPAEDGPRIRFEGREDRVINLSGAMVYPREIEDAVHSYDATADWRAVVTEEDEYPVLHIYVEGEAEDDIVPYLAEENTSVHAWYDAGGIKIRQHGYTSQDELAEFLDQYDLDVDLLGDDMKTTRIGFDASYTT